MIRNAELSTEAECEAVSHVGTDLCEDGGINVKKRDRMGGTNIVKYSIDYA